MAELSYHPVLNDADGAVSEFGPARLLIVGDTVPDTVGHAGAARVQADNSAALPTGIYQFLVDGEALMLVVTDGGVPGYADSADWTAPDDHPLVNAYGWFCHLWAESAPVEPPRFAVGDDVMTVPAGQEAKVRRRYFTGGTWSYQVRVDGQSVVMRQTQLTRPDIDDDPFAWVTRPASSARRFAATLSRAKLRDHLSDTLYSFRATRTIFRPYQFRPVIRLLATGSLRLLIADEVGLGKTIEAGLVWTELDARNQASRVLVVCPSMLVPKWCAEMEERFGYHLAELRRDGLDDLLARVESDRLPARYHAVCGLERLRGWPGLEQLAEIGPHFDLVIVDEAHAFRNADTKSHALGALLAEWGDALVFLSATPLNLGNEDLFNLLSLLAPGEFDNAFVFEQQLQPNAVLNRIGASLLDRGTDNATRRAWLHSMADLAFGPAVAARPDYAALDRLLSEPSLTPADVVDARRMIAQLHALGAVVTRTRKVEIQDHKAVRDAVSIEVAWTPAEAAFYQAFALWQRQAARRRGLPVGFVTQMPLRLASSCLPAARQRVIDWDAAGWKDEDLDADADADDENSDDVAEPPPPELVSLALGLGDVDTKFDALLAELLPVVRSGKRVLLFTFSRAALAYLQDRLSAHVRLAVLHGDIRGDHRHDIMRRFRAHEFDVLAASRVASEGLDFEFCSAVVNWDLPWNPMEVEQRIGRIDRFGQTEDKVLILNFHTPGTIESDIIERCLRRIGVFTNSIGELEPILQSQIAELRRTMFDFTLTDDQRTRRLDEMLAAVEEQRRTKDDVENATAYLSSTDNAEIDGLEHDLVSNGRYVGQPELVLLMKDWVDVCPGASCATTADGRRFTLRGTAQMGEHLAGVAAAGERSAVELDRLAKALREEQDITLCLDQELARTTGEPLLSATHPLTRAALRVPGHVLARFADVRYQSGAAPPGRYLVLVAVARWRGLRPAAELWTAAVSLDTGLEAADAVGAGLLAGLADAGLDDGAPHDGEDIARALGKAQRSLLRRQGIEESRRIAENQALTDIRRISLRETHLRKVDQIQRRIETLRAGGKTKVIHLQEAQLRNQDRLVREAEQRLAATSQGSMDLEYIAVCTAQVTAQP